MYTRPSHTSAQYRHPLNPFYIQLEEFWFRVTEPNHVL